MQIPPKERTAHWHLYEKYLERVSGILGDDVAKVIEFESVNEMKEMSCTDCPLFEKHNKPRQK
jgi:hypothetical protein